MSTVLERDIEQAIDAAGDVPPAPIALTDATNRALAALLSIAEDVNQYPQVRTDAASVITDLCAAWFKKDTTE